MQAPTWKNVLHNNGWRITEPDELNDLAIETGYEFFLWEGKVYRSIDGFWSGYTEDQINCNTLHNPPNLC